MDGYIVMYPEWEPVRPWWRRWWCALTGRPTATPRLPRSVDLRNLIVSEVPLSGPCVPIVFDPECPPGRVYLMQPARYDPAVFVGDWGWVDVDGTELELVDEGYEVEIRRFGPLEPPGSEA